MKNVCIVSQWVCQQNKGLKIRCNKETNKTISSDILDILARHVQQYGQVQTIDIDSNTDRGKCEGKKLWAYPKVWIIQNPLCQLVRVISHKKNKLSWYIRNL